MENDDVEKYIAIGIVSSYGLKNCDVSGHTGVFTRVGYYLDWINQNLN